MLTHTHTHTHKSSFTNWQIPAQLWGPVERSACSLSPFKTLTPFLLFNLTQGHVHQFLERGKEREHRLVASHTYPNQRWNPQPRYVPWPGIKPEASFYTGQCSNQRSPLARADPISFLSVPKTLENGHQNLVSISNQKGSLIWTECIPQPSSYPSAQSCVW